MKRNRIVAVALGAGLLLTSISFVAHHSISAEFDTNKRVTFTGTVKKIDWMNPHIYTHVEVKEADGKIIVYKVEGGAPNALYRQGVRAESLPPGTIVTCTNCSRSKSPESMNVNGRLTREDGSAALAPTVEAIR
ncbi:MAG TPA: DUF6152 family protein [Terriglobia bacterium]|nr:DUF6152 family protein [Terriglobia bacterium]